METVKGFRDITDEEALKREKIRELLVKKFKIYGFVPAETPVIESEEFAKAGQAEETISDIFRLKDKGQRALALRYELTFQLKRLAQNKKLPYRRYQIGEVFRDEPTSSNRFRQFTQCDIDIIGSNTRDEAEILKLFSEILKELRIEANIYINNRKLLNEIIEEQEVSQKDKLQVIKEIDKLDKLSEQEVKANLRKYKAENLIALFKKPKSYFKRYITFKEIQELEQYCKEYGVKVEFLPNLARGLAYYNGSVFEIKTKMMKESIAGGGSYLVNAIQGTGISFGLDRLSTLAKVSIDKPKAIIISIAQDKAAIALAERLRSQEISCFIMDKISKALEYANSLGIPFVIFIGKEEIKKKKFKLRDMRTGKEALLAESALVKKLTNQ
ncbi:MAG: ATP phosphoribosyltransferase regulatory subunit [Candidatus Pacearchaeota archaeon]